MYSPIEDRTCGDVAVCAHPGIVFDQRKTIDDAVCPDRSASVDHRPMHHDSTNADFGMSRNVGPS